jgi:hypothetical protein
MPPVGGLRVSELMAGIRRALGDAGLVPEGGGLDLEGDPDATAGDFLPALTAAWRRAAAEQTGSSSSRQTRSMAQWLDQQCSVGAEMTLGIPGVSADLGQRWLGLRIAWWPDGMPTGKRVGLVSSRLDKSLDRHEIWFAMLRAACAKVDSSCQRLVTATSTSLARFVARSAELFELPLLTIETPRDDAMPLDRWLRRIRRAEGHDREGTGYRLCLSPPLPNGEGERGESVAITIPPRDRALVALSDRLLVFRVRAGGHVHQLLRFRLQDPGWPPGSVFVALGPDLVSADIASELLDLGAVGWIVPAAWAGQGPSESNQVAGPAAADPAARAGPPRLTIGPAPIVPLPRCKGWHFLTHCTRGPGGPWPEQTDEDYLDDLILSRPAARHRPIDALSRIVRTRRLIATGQAIRGGSRVVSFTAIPLADLDRLRVFRSHRGRWDFEPYGIAIRRCWLEHRGARPVRYGDEDLWARLPASDRRFFQCRETQTGGHTIDWSVECEWRHPGDVDLSHLRRDDAMLFVASQDEAEALAPLSPWPVTVVPRRSTA